MNGVKLNDVTFQVISFLIVDEFFGEELLDQYEAIFNELVLIITNSRWTFCLDHCFLAYNLFNIEANYNKSIFRSFYG